MCELSGFSTLIRTRSFLAVCNLRKKAFVMTTRSKITLPPTVPLTINRDQNSSRPFRTDSLGLSNDELMGMIAHTPPAFTPGSLELPLTKRSRSGSISGRLRSASDLEERGVIDRYQKGVLKVNLFQDIAPERNSP